jgi:formamidopyrimidine-DNA glycosylase
MLYCFYIYYFEAVAEVFNSVYNIVFKSAQEMPELPEVETSVRAIQGFSNKILKSISVSNSNLRWPVDLDSFEKIQKQRVFSITRRAKYILFNLKNKTILLHLGMTGTIRITEKDSNFYKKHDHLRFTFNNGELIYNDPRRFGSIHLVEDDEDHFLLNKLGPEPLTQNFNGEYFYQAIKNSSAPIKSALMNQHHVVGVGNIYANEILFDAGIRPTKRCRALTKKETSKIEMSAKKILQRAIEMGGTTLQDFFQPDGNKGYFKIELAVYDRAEERCIRCNKQKIKRIVQAQRATFFCKDCQT